MRSSDLDFQHRSIKNGIFIHLNHTKPNFIVASRVISESESEPHQNLYPETERQKNYEALYVFLGSFRGFLGENV
jgi:hypothetical protein